MRRRFLFFTIIVGALLISACNLVSKQSTNALQEVLKFTGGHVSLNMDYGYTTENGKTKTAKLDVSNSDLVKQYSQVPGMIASNVAYIFYNALDSEKRTITNVDVTIEVDEHTTSRFDYSSELLDSVSRMTPEVDKVVDLFKKQHMIVSSVCVLMILAW
jgi:hypothetical protein